MAEALLSVLLQQLASLAQQPIQEQVSLVVGVEREIESLPETLRIVRAVVADAEKRQVKDDLVKIWLEGLKDIAYQMADVLDEWRTALLQSQIKEAESSSSRPHRERVSSCVSIPCVCFRRVCGRRDIALKIKSIKQQLDRIATERVRFNFTPISSQVPERLITISAVDISNVFGRDNDRDIVLRQLLGQGCQENMGLDVISVVGLGGIGKTTLAQLVFNHDEVKTHFDQRIWVCVSDPFIPGRIFRSILEALLGQYSGLHDPEALQRQIQTIIEGRKFLLVLDDVWNEDGQLWEQLENCLKHGGAGSKILVTTRNQNVARLMRSTYMHYLGSLPIEQCRKLFSQIAFYGKSNEKIKELGEIGERLADKCKGLPLAIKTLGSLMQSKDRKEDWEDILNSETWELVGENLSPALLLSYYDLPPTLKQCFSYCAVFPKDHVIEIDRLIKLWMAQGYLSYNTKGEMERLGRKHFENLAARSFFQDFEKDEEGNIIMCKMHDIVHDFAQFLTHDECFILEIGSENQKTNLALQKYRHATLVVNETNTFTSSIPNASNLHTILVVTSMEKHGFLPEPLQHFKYLRALDLRDNGSIEELPEEVGTLVYLRYLGLSRCRNLGTLTESICCLCNLQTLDIRGTRLRELPQGIGKLVNLRHLGNGGTDMLNLPKGVGSLTSLRTLPTYIVGDKDERNACKIEDLGNLKEIRGNLEIIGVDKVEDAGEAQKAGLKNKKQLCSLRLNFISRPQRVVEKQKEVVEALQPHPNLKSLWINGYGGGEWPRWMMGNSTLHQLRDLDLSCCGHCERLPPLGELPRLESLFIYRMKRLKYVGAEFLGSSAAAAAAIAFPKLRILTFNALAEWENWELKEDEDEEEGQVIMPCLRSLCLLSCRRLKNVPEIILRRVPAVLDLTISGCNFLEKRRASWGRTN